MKKKSIEKVNDIINFIENLKDYNDLDEFNEYMKVKEVRL